MQGSWLEKFKTEVMPILVKEYKPENIILFGSQVTGKADESSDIDVIIVSKAFAKLPFIKRMPHILKRIDFEKHIDLICYSPKEFENIKTRSSLIIDAIDTGIWLV